MSALRWFWNFLIPAVGAACCFVAMWWSLLVGDDPAHVWLVYTLGFAWFSDALTDALRDVERKERERST